LGLRVTFLRSGAHQLKRIPGFAVGGHYFSEPRKHNDRAADFKPRIPLPLRAAACYKITMAAPLKIAFLGAGKMATALAKGFINAQLVKANQLCAADPFDAARKHFAAATGAKAVAANLEAAQAAKVLILATKPDQVAAALAEISSTFTQQHLLISIAAGVTLAKLEAALPAGARVIRVMPNTPALVGAGAAGFALGKNATTADGELAKKLLSAVGVALQVKESLLDAVTGLSGSGPAYVYQFIEALSDGGVASGLPRDIATKLAAQTVLGGAKMVLATGQHPGALKDQVTSPGGTTIEGLHELEKGKLRATVISAVRAATEKSKKLGQV
jgi:pyrroline-5-carboxylate reductase